MNSQSNCKLVNLKQTEWFNLSKLKVKYTGTKFTHILLGSEVSIATQEKDTVLESYCII